LITELLSPVVVVVVVVVGVVGSVT